MNLFIHDRNLFFEIGGTGFFKFQTTKHSTGKGDIFHGSDGFAILNGNTDDLGCHTQWDIAEDNFVAAYGACHHRPDLIKDEQRVIVGCCIAEINIIIDLGTVVQEPVAIDPSHFPDIDTVAVGKIIQVFIGYGNTWLDPVIPANAQVEVILVITPIF